MSATAFQRFAIAASLLGATSATLAFDFVGAALPQALDELEARGLSILYSSDLVKRDMRVANAPEATAPRGILEEIVAPHGIAVAEGPGGALVLTRASRRAVAQPGAASGALTEVIVTASRYELVRIPQPSLTRLSEAELHLAPNVGDDPLRTLARLPGATGSDLSAKLHVRGGLADETLVRFDGLRLVNPFHLKDFQSVFSAINPALVGAIDVYTGGFPASYGDRMSGVIDIHPVRAEIGAQGEVAVSLYNASALASGRIDQGRGDWAISARRGNLERVLDWSGMNLGQPEYSDFYAHAGHQLGDSAAASVNFLMFDDDITLADSDLEERARARYRDRYLWLRLDMQPHESLTGGTLLARADLDSVRSGVADQPGIARGSLDDHREFTIDSLQSDWRWRLTGASTLQLGGELRRSDGRYAYRDEAEFDLTFDVPGAVADDSRQHDLTLAPRGDHYGAYAALRTELTPSLVAEGGLRWDRSTFAEGNGDVSPRLSALWRIGVRTSLRASWGRYLQTQSVDELAAPDGVTAFSSAQRADQQLVSLEQQLTGDVELRIEAYRKRYDRLQPRFENLLNTVVILPELKPDRLRLAPVSAESRGVELSVRCVRSRPLFWWASYTWSRVEDRYRNGEVRRSWDQQHSFNGGVGWESERWELSLAGAWRSGWPTTPLELTGDADDPIVTTSSPNTRRLRSYVDIDARIARRFALAGGGSLTAFFELSNATNRRNECCIEYEIEDESDTPLLVLETIRSLPLLPSVGVIWRF